MSGYLFFVEKEDFCFSVYKKKITKKVRTLLVPYIIWNFVALFLNYGYSYLTKGSLGDVMPWNLVEILWKHGEGIMGTSTLGYQYPVIVSPTAGVLWFIILVLLNFRVRYVFLNITFNTYLVIACKGKYDM